VLYAEDNVAAQANEVGGLAHGRKAAGVAWSWRGSSH
jgi:hypothetical protein